MQLSKDIEECIELFHSKGVEFLLVGGYALAAHGAPRFTEDIDFFIRISRHNAEKVLEALLEFGFPRSEIRVEDFLEPEHVIQFGRPPHRIDILTSIDGVTWEQAWESRTELALGTKRCWAIGLTALIQNKRASGRPQDLADVARLEGAQKQKL
jgi:hypothetical protein